MWQLVTSIMIATQCRWRSIYKAKCCGRLSILEASKAFVKVNHQILFKKLTECNVPEIFVKLLSNWYSSQLLCVKWGTGTTYSKFFTVFNRVRQGSILSPIPFAVYMNQLSQTLNKLNVGCFIGQHCLNNILYADDICCIALSCKGLQKLLDVSYEHVQSHDISFNCSKNKIMMFKTKFLNQITLFFRQTYYSNLTFRSP